MPPARGRYSAEFQLTADTGGLKRGFADARRQQQQFLGVSRNGWRQFGRQATIGLGVATTALAGFAAAGLSAARDISALQRQTNLSAEAASNWRLALRAVGGDISDVEDVLRTLNSRVIEFAKGESTATDAFRAIGASVSDFDLSDPSQQLQAFLGLLERAPHSSAQFAADELVGDTSRFVLQLAAARRETELLQRSFGRQLADSGQIAEKWNLIRGFAGAAVESIGVSFLRGLTSGIGSTEELAMVLEEQALPVARSLERIFHGIGEDIRDIVGLLNQIRTNWPEALTPWWARDNTRFYAPRVGGAFGVEPGVPPAAGVPAPPPPREPNRLPELAVVGRRITLHETPLHRVTRAISDRAIEGERLAAARRRILLASLQPGPLDDPRGRLAQATPDFRSRFAQQQDLAQQAWWQAFWQNTGRSLQQGLTQSIGGAVQSFVSGPDAGSLRSLGQNLLQALSATFARVFAQSLVDATIGRALGGVFSAAFAGAGAGTAAGPVGFYNEGGIVPGPVGRPQAAVVHGGEAIFTPEQLQAIGRGGTTVLNFYLADVSRQAEDAVNDMLDRIVAAVGRDRYERGLPA